MAPYCARCSQPAVALLSYDYGTAMSWLDDLTGQAVKGDGHPLCNVHASRFGPPVGWSLVDRRGRMTPLFAPPRVA